MAGFIRNWTSDPKLAPKKFFYYHVVYMTTTRRPPYEQQRHAGVVELLQPPNDSGNAVLRLMAADGALLVQEKRALRCDWQSGARLRWSKHLLIEFRGRMSESEFHSGSWHGGAPAVAEPDTGADAAADMPADHEPCFGDLMPRLFRDQPQPQRPIRRETANAVMAIRTIGRGRAPERDLHVADLQRAIATEFKIVKKLAREYEQLEGRNQDLERENDCLRQRLAELSTVEEMLQR